MKIFKTGQVICCLFISMLIFLSGCTNPVSAIGKVQIVKDLGDDEVFRINNESCSITEAKFFFAAQKNIYETSYGNEIWNSQLCGKAFSNYVKGDLKTFLTRLKILKLMAKEYGTELSNEDVRIAKQAASELYSGMTEDELKYTGCTEDDVFGIFKEFRLIDNYLNDFTEDINTEISEDDARVITIQNILIRTTSIDDQGNVTPLSEEEKAACYRKAETVYELSMNGTDFGTLAAEYSDSDQIEINLERNVMGEEFDKVAFSLEEGQVGGIIESEYGYHIIKCIDSYNEELTAEHKDRMQAEYKSEYYEKAYNDFTQNVTALFNDKLWNSILINTSLDLSGQDFFTVYYKYFS